MIDGAVCAAGLSDGCHRLSCQPRAGIDPRHDPASQTTTPSSAGSPDVESRPPPRSLPVERPYVARRLGTQDGSAIPVGGDGAPMGRTRASSCSGVSSPVRRCRHRSPRGSDPSPPPITRVAECRRWSSAGAASRSSSVRRQSSATARSAGAQSSRPGAARLSGARVPLRGKLDGKLSSSYPAIPPRSCPRHQKSSDPVDARSSGRRGQ